MLTVNVGSISLSEAWGKTTNKKKQMLSDIHSNLVNAPKLSVQKKWLTLSPDSLSASHWEQSDKDNNGMLGLSMIMCKTYLYTHNVYS